MDRKTFMRELEYLLQDINEEERNEALSFYNDYFDEAGIENESKVISELGEPSRVAAIIKAGLSGQFDENIKVSSEGIYNDDYIRNYEVIDADINQKNKTSQIKEKWNELCTKDRILLIILAIIAILPLSRFIGNIFEISLSITIIAFCLLFGFWIISIICSIIAVMFIVIGVIHLFSLPGAGLIYIGIGCLIMALATIFEKAASYFTKTCIPSIIDKLSHFVDKIIRRRGAKYENNI